MIGYPSDSWASWFLYLTCNSFVRQSGVCVTELFLLLLCEIHCEIYWCRRSEDWDGVQTRLSVHQSVVEREARSKNSRYKIRAS